MPGINDNPHDVSFNRIVMIQRNMTVPQTKFQEERRGINIVFYENSYRARSPLPLMLWAFKSVWTARQRPLNSS